MTKIYIEKKQPEAIWTDFVDALKNNQEFEAIKQTPNQENPYSKLYKNFVVFSLNPSPPQI